MYRERRFTIFVLIVLVSVTFSFRLFYIQIVDDEYKTEAENNIILTETEYAYRGLLYDRNDKLLVYNNPVFDLMVVPREVKGLDTLKFCQTLEITKEDFEAKLKKAWNYAYGAKPSTFMEMIPEELFAKVQDQLINFPGFFARSRTVRKYPHTSLANSLGYVGEINRRLLNKDTTNYYRQGDYIGISGVESEYEEQLRGTRGVRVKMRNNKGVVKGAFRDGAYDTLSVPGLDLKLTIDLDIQQYAEKLMEGKVGSLVAIEPSTGEILALVSAPSYDPNLLSGRDFGTNFQALQQDSLKPIFNRPFMAMYPPGSMFKTVQSLISLQEGVVHPYEKIYSDGTLIGDLAPNGYYDVKKAIKNSSNNYYYKVFKRVINRKEDPNQFIDTRIGLEKWKKYVNNFALGEVLDCDLPNVKKGYVPSLERYDRMYGKNRWKYSNIGSLSIGQGELLVTPLQMANLGAILANKGYYFTPHIVKSIGDSGQPLAKYQTPNYVGIDSTHFPIVIDGMELVIMEGSGTRAFVPGLGVCGKTSTVQNPHGEDHSGFMGFAPKENPRIAIAVYVENAGWGGRAAASIAGLVIEKYVSGEITRPWIEEFALKGEFIY
jgi:penicillin-binding protein 2